MAAPGDEAGRKLIIEPDEGAEPLLDFFSSARRQLLVKQYLFNDGAIVKSLTEAHRRGVEVRVMLNPARGSGERPNDGTFERLEEEGVAVRWTSPRFPVTHEKSAVADGRRTLISTFNLCPKYLAETRDYGLVCEEREVADEVAGCFEADWARGDFVPRNGAGLLWGNVNARPRMAGFIDGARCSLDVQHPKFVDLAILERLVHAASRGVRIRVLSGALHGVRAVDWGRIDTLSSLRILRRCGAQVRRQRRPKPHAKLLVADGASALLGSLNIDRNAFDFRRELGIVLEDERVVDKLQGVFEADWAGASDYDVPDPLVPHADEAGEEPADPGLNHE